MTVLGFCATAARMKGEYCNNNNNKAVANTY